MKTPGAARRGFTLIELMLVSAIIGLLAAISIPRFVNLIDKAKEASLKGSMGALRAALAIYYADTEGKYPNYSQINPNVYVGLYALHGEYIDMSRMVFQLPSYIPGPKSYSAIEIYQPWADAGTHEKDYPPDPPIPHYGGAFLPTYWLYTPAWPPTAPPILGAIGMDANYLDTYGRPWSNW